MAELNFLEYNVNPDTHAIDDIVIKLNSLGFNKISVSKDGRMSMWALNKCVFLINTSNKFSTGLSGFGLNAKKVIDGSKHCESSGLNIANYNGINIYTYPVELFKKTYDEYFTSVGPAGVDVNIEYFAGIVLNFDHVNQVNFVNESLDFRVVKRSMDYITSVCEHNRFNMLWRLTTKDIKIPTVVVKTDSVSDVTAKYVTQGFDSSELSKVRLDEIKDIYAQDNNLLPPKHFIEGWQINLSGKPKSFVMDKQFVNVLPNLNLLVSERHNHNGVNEESVIYFNSEEESANVV